MKIAKDPLALPLQPAKGDEGYRMSTKASFLSPSHIDPVLQEFAANLARKGRSVILNARTDFEWPTATGFNQRNAGSYVISFGTPSNRVRSASTSSARKVATRVRELAGEALRVWNNQTDANEWMQTKLYELGDRTPIEACATDDGLEEAKKVLLRIAYGAPA